MNEPDRICLGRQGNDDRPHDAIGKDALDIILNQIILDRDRENDTNELESSNIYRDGYDPGYTDHWHPRLHLSLINHL